MRAKILFPLLAVLILAGCSADSDSLNSIEVSGRLVSQVTGEGVSDGLILAKVNEYHGSGMLAYTVELSSKQIQTDVNGYFTTTLNYKDEGNVFLFEQINEQVATGMLQEQENFYLSDLENGSALNFVVRKYEKLKIGLKSTSPYDENDAIEISIYQKNTNYFNNIIYQIENFGDQNQPYEDPASENGLNPYWIGDHVDSVIYGYIQEGTSVQVKWSVRKNGIVNSFQSDFFETVSDEVNLFEINY